MPTESEDQILRLLKCCCRIRLSASDRERLLAEISESPDWDRLVDTAIHHRVDGFLLKHLRSLDKVELLGERGARLGERSQRSTLRNLNLTRELIELLEQLEAAGIQGIPYKGPVLMQQIYGDVGMRWTHDIDILIHPRDRDECERIVSGRGFETITEKSEFGRRIQGLLEKDSEWHDPKRGLNLEVHWRFTKWYFPFSLDGRSFESGFRDYEWCGRRFRLMPPEETLLTLCLHGSVHEWHRLEMLTMVAEFCRQNPELDWTRLGRITTKSSGLRPLLLGLKLAHDHLAAPVPEDLLERANAEATVCRLAETVESQWSANQHEFSLLETMNFELSLLAGRWARLRYLLGQFTIAVLRPFTLRERTVGKTAARPFDLARRHSLGPGSVLRLLSKALHTR